MRAAMLTVTLAMIAGACSEPAEREPPAAKTSASAPAPPGATTPTSVPAPTAPALGPSFFGLELDLEDQAGRPVTTASLRHDGPLIVSMFYASCSYACPTLIRDVANIDRQLSPAARDKTRVLLVTFDPDHDTPAVLSQLASAHGVANERWIFARAKSEEATREIAAALGITYRRLPDGNYNHSSILLVLDADGVPRAGIDGLKQDPAAFVRSLESLVR